MILVTTVWEQRKLDDFGKSTGGVSIESEFIDDGKYKVISIGSYSETSTYNDQGIRCKLSNRTKDKILNKDDITMILNDKTASGNIIGRVLLIEKSGLYVYNQRTERIEINKEKYDPLFIYELLNAPNIREKIIKESQGNTQIYVNWTKIKELLYYIPSLNEQRKLGRYFNQIDNLITLHQRKYDKLVNVKKSLLEKMFPKNGSNIPEIRFDGFTEAWEQRKYEEIGNCVQGGNLSYADLDEKGKYKCVLYGELYTRYDTVIKDIINKTNKVSNEIKKNDILFPQSTTVDNWSLISPACMNDESAYTSGVFVIRPNKNIDGNFIAYYSKGNNNQHNKLAKNAQGLTIVHLYYQSIKDESILVPEIKEQKAISNLLMKLDNLITLHQRKLEKLKNVKKSLLEKMFV